MDDHGFGMLARAEALSGSSREWIQRVCELAWIEGAPRDVVCRIGRAWVRSGQITDPVKRMGLGLPRAEAAPVADTVTVKVRWTQVHQAVIEVPIDQAATGRDVMAWLTADTSWMSDPALEMLSTPFVNEVTMPQHTGAASIDDVGWYRRFALKARLLTELRRD